LGILINMQLNSKNIYDALLEKGVTNFYHANSVRTSLTFIKEKAFVSRAYVEDGKLDQTDQYTDTKDKDLGIWDSVFLDAQDLHNHFGINHYGPVLFELDLKLLLDPDFTTVQITKTNPANWVVDSPRFFESVDDFKGKYLKDGNFDKYYDSGVMFVFSSPGKKFDLKKYCRRIILDDPKITFTDDSTVFAKVKNTIEETLNQNGLIIPIVSRLADGKSHHYCAFQYRRMWNHQKEEFEKLFAKKQDNQPLES